MQKKGLLTVSEEKLNIAGTDRSKKHRLPRSLGISFSQISVLFLCIMLSMTIVNQNASAATWDPEEEISSDVGTEVQRFPSIAVNGSEVHVVWQDNGDGDRDIYYRYFDGTSWQTEQEISSDVGTEGQGSPSIAVDSGKVHVVWSDYGDGDYDIYYRYFDGTSWQTEQEISSDVGTENQYTPSIATEGGKVHVVWRDNGDGDNDIYYRYFDGTSWQPEQEISSDVGTEGQWRPSTAVNGSEVHVVWFDEGDGDYDIYYRYFDGTNWQPEQEISSDVGTEDQRFPSIAVNGSEVHVVWYDYGDGDADIYYRYFDGTNWQPEQEISSDVGTEIQNDPSIAVDSGKVHVVWQDNGDGDYDIYYRYFDGTSWQAEQEISSDVGTDWQYRPSIAANGSEVHVVWEDRGDGDSDIYYRYFDGTSWQAEQEISSDVGTEDQYLPSIAVDSGKVHVVWEDYGDGDRDIYYRYFDGTSWQAEQEISSDVGTEDQYNPSIAVEGGKVHVVWDGDGDGDYDIYYRYFDGTSWQPEQEISSDVGSEDQYYPSIAVEGGKVHVVWRDEGDGDCDIYYRYFDGTSWQPEQEISSDVGTEHQDDPSIAVEGGKVHVVWYDYGDGDWDIYYRYFDGTNWQTEQEISSDGLTEPQWNPSIAAEGGKVHVVWDDRGDGDRDIYYRYFDGTSWQTEQEISSDVGTEWQYKPSIAAEGGKVHVVWDDRGDGDRDIYYRYFDGTSWQTEQEISSDVGTEGQGSPSIAVDSGKVHVVWQDSGDGDNDIYYRKGVELPPSSFTVSVDPPSRTIAPGDTTTYTVTVTSVNNYAGDVDLSVTGLPGAATGTFLPNPVTVPDGGSVDSTLTIDNTDGVADNTYTLTITGTEGALTDSDNADLIVETGPPPSFTVSVTPPSRTIAPGDITTYTVTVASVNNYAGDVDLSITGLPGAATGTFLPNPVTVPDGGSVDSTLTIDNTDGVADNTYTLTITGTEGALTDSDNADLIVQAGPPPSLTVSVTPPSRTIAPGDTTTYTITVTSVDGYAGSVDISITGLPGAATGTFLPNPVTVPDGGSVDSTLTIDNTGGVADDTYTLTITGTEGALTDSDNADLIVQAGPPPGAEGFDLGAYWWVILIVIVIVVLVIVLGLLLKKRKPKAEPVQPTAEFPMSQAPPPSPPPAAPPESPPETPPEFPPEA